MNYYFIAYTACHNKSKVGGGAPIVACSCSIRTLHKALLDYYNECAVHKANNIIINSLTVLDKQTAAQLSNNFTNSALIIYDGEKEEKQVFIERWIARDKDGTLCLYWGENPPTKIDTLWDYGKDYVEIDGSLFPEVKWSDDEPTKVKLVIDK